MVTPNSNAPAAEQDPFQMSESASIVLVNDSDAQQDGLLPSHLFGTSNLSSLIWQLPYADRKSILHAQ